MVKDPQTETYVDERHSSARPAHTSLVWGREGQRGDK